MVNFKIKPNSTLKKLCSACNKIENLTEIFNRLFGL